VFVSDGFQESSVDFQIIEEVVVTGASNVANNRQVEERGDTLTLAQTGHQSSIPKTQG